VPALASEVNDGAGLVEEAHDFRADQAAIQLADGIDAAGQDSNAGQINDLSVIRMNKDTTRRGGESIQTNTDKILDFHSFNFLKLTTIDRFEIGLSDVLQGRQRPRGGAHARSCLARNHAAAHGVPLVFAHRAP